MTPESKEAAGRPLPITLFIAINIVLWLGLFFVFSRDASQTSRILMLAGLAVALMITVSVQVLLHFTLADPAAHPIRRGLLLFLPTALMLALAFALPGRTGAPNQQNLLPSPDGQYRLVISIRPGPETGPAMAWVLAIEDAAGSTLHTDTHSPFDATQTAVFWLWDTDNRAWLFSRADESTWYWERDADGAWTRTKYEASSGLKPPEGLRGE